MVLPDSVTSGRRNSIGMDYVPTEDERRVFVECNRESFWYRSVPLTAASVLVTQGLITKGVLSGHPKYGSLPKLAFAGIMGYFGGKISYVKACQEKFKHLENSPLGEAMRQRQGRRVTPPGYSSEQPTFPSDVSGHSSFGTPSGADSGATERPLPQYEPIPFSASVNESTPTGITDHVAQGPESYLEESPKKKNVTYEELRNRNRETYEVTLPPKGEPSSLRTVRDRMPSKEGKEGYAGSFCCHFLRSPLP
uniref:OCIA domain-containing protein 1 n=1 Tax=Ornithorhynchus anatinus TaxID=9258 RepID=A0A6I8NUY6_ORNAN